MSPRRGLPLPFRGHLAFAALLAACLGSGTALADGLEPVELELVLAVDCSSSVSTGEFQLQMQGIAAAFEHPAVAKVIEATAPRGIAVSLMQWSSKANQVSVIEWTRVVDAESAQGLAASIRAAPRAVGGGSTAIGSAMLRGIKSMEANQFAGARRSIDVSGDGATNQGPPADRARAVAVALGITVNALAIQNENPTLARYYSRDVVGGPSAFLVSTDNYEDFARAMLKKLVTEISGPPVAGLPDQGARAHYQAARNASHQ